MILNNAKDYYKNNKERLRKKARDKYINLSEVEKNLKREMGRIDIIICLKKRNEYQKIITRQKSLNIIMNKIIF